MLARRGRAGFESYSPTKILRLICKDVNTLQLSCQKFSCANPTR
jgi:hypothetical protein